MRRSRSPSERATPTSPPPIRGRLAYGDLNARGPVEALRRIDRALAETPDLDLAGVRVGLRDNPRLRLSIFRAYALVATGRLAEALAIFREVHSVACERRQLTSEFSALIGWAALMRVLGEGEAAIEIARNALARARAVESPYWQSGAGLGLVFGQAVAGDWPAVLATIDKMIPMEPFKVTRGVLRAESLWRTGAVAEARAQIREVEPLLSDVRSQAEVGPTFRFTWQLSLARVVLGLDGAAARAQVEHYLDLASERPRREESLVGAAYVSLERAELARALGDEADWRGQLESARARLRERPRAAHGGGGRPAARARLRGNVPLNRSAGFVGRFRRY